MGVRSWPDSLQRIQIKPPHPPNRLFVHSSQCQSLQAHLLRPAILSTETSWSGPSFGDFFPPFHQQLLRRPNSTFPAANEADAWKTDETYVFSCFFFSPSLATCYVFGSNLREREKEGRNGKFIRCVSVSLKRQSSESVSCSVFEFFSFASLSLSLSLC